MTLYTFAADPSRPACTAPNDAFALYAASGDFQPDPSSPAQASVRLDAISPALSALPASTRQLAIDAQATQGQWRGFGPVSDSGDVSILLWPHGHDCAFSKNVDKRSGATITPYDDRHVLVTGGSGQPSFVADLSDGSVASIDLDVRAPRSNASATAFDGGVVVAGGTTGNLVLDKAEIFEAKSAGFPSDPISLAVPRTEQGATRLANGSILLVGGAGSDGGVYESLESIDPETRHSSEIGLATLATARKNPIVLTLTGGEVLVAGGTDAKGNAVGTVEFFSADATQANGTAIIPASSHTTLVALPSGGALAVVSPDTPGATTVSLIRPDHVVESAPSIASFSVAANVRLFAGTDGAPLLWTGSTWLRWSPWTGAFVQFAETASATGGSSAGGPPVDVDARVLASPDSGLALWLGDAGSLTGLRFDDRGVYSTDVKSLLATDTSSFAPDRLPGADVHFEGAESTDPSSGLTLGNGASAFLTDATFADFSLSFDTGKLETPIVVLRASDGTELTIGVDGANTTCTIADANQIRVVRHGDAISASSDGGAFATCGSIASSKRVSIGLRGRSGSNIAPSKARDFTITRD
ncbi:MAG TPA: kelch repeat-containing protein [Polyangiaceae bacterium]